MRNLVIPGRIQMARFIPMEIFRKERNTFRGITFSLFYRNIRNFLYHLWGLSNTVDENPVVSPWFPSENRKSSGVKSYQVYWMHWTLRKIPRKEESLSVFVYFVKRPTKTREGLLQSVDLRVDLPSGEQLWVKTIQGYWLLSLGNLLQ